MLISDMKLIFVKNRFECERNAELLTSQNLRTLDRNQSLLRLDEMIIPALPCNNKRVMGNSMAQRNIFPIQCGLSGLNEQPTPIAENKCPLLSRFTAKEQRHLLWFSTQSREMNISLR